MFLMKNRLNLSGKCFFEGAILKTSFFEGANLIYSLREKNILKMLFEGAILIMYFLRENFENVLFDNAFLREKF